MKKNLFIGTILLHYIIIISVYSSDVDTAGNPYPHGITSSGLYTEVSKNGTKFIITGGTQVGNNLFHSFEKFNVHSKETAQFKDSGIENTVSRVTGADSSWINGKIQSSANNLFIINPKGIEFGPGASIDVNGSFHVSTSNYIKFEDGSKFYANINEKTTLSVSSPQSFGFLNDQVGKIHISDSNLNVGKKKNISISGHGVKIENSTIKAPGGNIHIESIKSSGEIQMIGTKKNKKSNDQHVSNENLDFSTPSLYTFTNPGDIIISKNSMINVSGEKPDEINNVSGEESGNLFIKGNQVNIYSSKIYADSYGNQNGGITNIKANILNFYSSLINGYNYGTGSGGSIIVNAHEEIFIQGNMGPESGSEFMLISKENSTGNAGNINLTTKYLTIDNGSDVATVTLGKGSAGNVKISASEAVVLKGNHPKGNNQGSSIKSATHGQMSGAGNGGNLEIETKRLNVKDAGQIACMTIGTGNGGKMTINATESIVLEGNKYIGAMASGILVASYNETSKEAGDAGNLFINTRKMSLRDGAQVYTLSKGAGKAGEIEINASDFIHMSGHYPNSTNGSLIVASSTGQGKLSGETGLIRIKTGELYINDYGSIISNSESNNTGGDIIVDVTNSITIKGFNKSTGYGGTISAKSIGSGAGNIRIKAKNLSIYEKGRITTDSKNSKGGKIDIETKEIFYLHDGTVSSSVEAGSEKGGDIILNTKYLVLNEGHLVAGADEGNGGAIYVYPQYYIKAKNSELSARSKKGNDGIVRIDSPPVEILDELTKLNAEIPDTEKWRKNQCDSRIGGEKSNHIYFSKRDAISQTFDDLLPAVPPGYKQDALSLIKQSAESELFSKGKKAFESGEFDRAIQIWKENISDLNLNSDTYIISLVYLSHAQQKAGYHNDGLLSFLKLLPLVDKEFEHDEKLLFYSRLSDIYLSLGDIDKAENYINKAIEISKYASSSEFIAGMYNNYGNILVVKKYFDEAYVSYQKSIKISDNKFQNSVSYINLISIQDKEPENDKSILISAMDEIRDLPLSYEKAIHLITLSQHIQHSETDDQIINDLLSEAFFVGEELHNFRIQSYAKGFLGNWNEKTGNIDSAISLTQKALTLVEHKYYPEISYLWNWQMARNLKSKGDTLEAIYSYKKAIANLTPIQGEFYMGYRLQINIFQKLIKPVFIELTELYLSQSSLEENKDIEQSLLKKARDTMELCKKAELENFYKDECISVTERDIEILNHIPSNTALIYPIILYQEVVILLSLSDEIIHYKLPVNSTKLNKWANRFRKRLENKSKGYRMYAEDIYAWLILPIQEDLIRHNIHQLLWVPDGSLRSIPLAALSDGEKYLIQKYAIATLPNVRATKPESINLDNMNALLYGLSEARDGFSSLPNVPIELDSIEKIVDGKKLVDNDYTISSLKTELKKHEYSIIHMATHGFFGNNPENNFLLTYDDKLTINQLVQLINIGKYRQNPIHLMVLSACQTAIGDDRSILGLAGTALKAGVKSSIATLWFVSDHASSMVISDFYLQLKNNPGISKAQALKNAQCTCIQQFSLKHPFYWAPFLLIGDWH
ncbi:protein containing Filamentous hemagglutinin [Candidatus Magnetomorum sp. HK-1]|nr:protein containing Filamentous hemagglutinin [Candidatus Magnetomorum sp. HK-1]